VSNEARMPTVSWLDRWRFASRAYCCTCGSMAVARAARCANAGPWTAAWACSAATPIHAARGWRAAVLQVASAITMARMRGLFLRTSCWAMLPPRLRPHQHDLVGGENLQQRLDVVHGGREVEPAGGRAVAPQIRGHERKAILQGRDLAVPGVVVEGRAVEQDQGGISGRSRRLTDPVAKSGVGAQEHVTSGLSCVLIGKMGFTAVGRRRRTRCGTGTWLNPQLTVKYPKRGAIKRIPRRSAVTADDEARGRRQARLWRAWFCIRLLPRVTRIMRTTRWLGPVGSSSACP
jgi:hypothetical protein